MGANAVVVVLASLATFAAIFPATRYVMEWPTQSQQLDSIIDTRFAGEPVLDESWWQHRLLRRMPDATAAELDAGKAYGDQSSQEDGTVIVESSLVKPNDRDTASKRAIKSKDADNADDRDRNSLSPAEWAKVVRERPTSFHVPIFESVSCTHICTPTARSELKM